MSLFPPGFLWGAATAAHQVEGNNVNSDLWVLEHVQPTLFATTPGLPLPHKVIFSACKRTLAAGSARAAISDRSRGSSSRKWVSSGPRHLKPVCATPPNASRCLFTSRRTVLARRTILGASSTFSARWRAYETPWPPELMCVGISTGRYSTILSGFSNTGRRSALSPWTARPRIKPSSRYMGEIARGNCIPDSVGML